MTTHIDRECELLGHEFAVDHENDPPTCLHCGAQDPAWQDRQADRLTKGWRDYRTETWASKDIEEVASLIQAAQSELDAFGDQNGVAEFVINILAKARAILIRDATSREHEFTDADESGVQFCVHCGAEHDEWSNEADHWDGQ